MRDFIPEGEDAGSPVNGKGGFRDFIPQEEIDARKAENEAKLAKKEEVAVKSKKGGKKAKKVVSKGSISAKGEFKEELSEVEVEETEAKVKEEEVEAPKTGKKHSFK